MLTIKRVRFLATLAELGGAIRFVDNGDLFTLAGVLARTFRFAEELFFSVGPTGLHELEEVSIKNSVGSNYRIPWCSRWIVLMSSGIF